MHHTADLATAIAKAVRREPIGVADGKSGTPLERLTLDGGRVVVTKRIRPGGDWIMRNMHDEGRAIDLWRRGILQRIPPTLDHGVLGTVDTDDGWLLVMRDLGEWIFADRRRITRDEHCRVVTAFHALHRRFEDEAIDGLCPMPDRYTVLSPAMGERERESGAVVPTLVGRGWDVFTSTVESDVAVVVARLLDDPAPLVAALQCRRVTLVHGDMKPANLGLAPHAAIAVDWGTQTGMAPAAVDWAWYLATAASSIDATRDQILDDIRATEGDHHDPVALELALLGGLVQLGWNKALDAREHPDAGMRAREHADLDWWVDRAARTLERHPL